ncbi:MAG: hypothetical protein ACM3ZB_03875 [bacterium]
MSSIEREVAMDFFRQVKRLARGPDSRLSRAARELLALRRARDVSPAQLRKAPKPLIREYCRNAE